MHEAIKYIFRVYAKQSQKRALTIALIRELKRP